MTDQRRDGAPRSLAGSTVRGLTYLTSSTLITSLLRIVVVGTMARLLVPEDFGIVAVANIFVEFARMITTTGVAHSLVQRPTLSENEIKTAFTSSLGVGLATMAAVILLAPWIAQFFEMPKLVHILYACSVIPPAVAASAISSKLLERNHNFEPIAMSGIVSYVVAQVAIGIPIAIYGGGVWALVVPQIVSAFLQSAMLFRAQPHAISLYFGRSEYRDLMKLGTGFGLQRFANFFAQRGDYFVVGKVLGPLDLGRYERSYVLMNISNSLLASMLNTVLFPAFSRVADDKDRFRRAYCRCIGIATTITLPASIICVVLAHEIVGTMLGDRWLDATTPFAILAAGIQARTCYKVAGSAGNGLGLAYENAVSQTIYAVFVIGGALVGSNWGVNGVACSTLVAIFVVFIALNNTVIRRVDITWRQILSTMFPGLCSGLLLGLVSFGTIYVLRGETPFPAFVRLISTIAVDGLVYLGFVLFKPSVFLGSDTVEFIVKRLKKIGPAGRMLRILSR